MSAAGATAADLCRKRKANGHFSFVFTAWLCFFLEDELATNAPDDDDEGGQDCVADSGAAVAAR